MKKLIFCILPLITVILCSCGNMTEEVHLWFLTPSISNIDFDLDGVTGSAEFTYYSENNNKILFTSGDGLEGVEFSFTDGTVTAARDGLVWETTPEMTETLALFGKLYSHAASQTYNANRTNTDNDRYVTDTFPYLDGSFEVVFSKETAKPYILTYTQDSKTVKLTINDIQLIIDREAAEQTQKIQTEE